MLSIKWKDDRENHLVYLWQETGDRGRARRAGKRKSGLKDGGLPQTEILGNGR